MGRRKSTLIEDIVDIGSLMPWWLSLTAAAATWLLFRHLAQLDPGTAAGIEDAGRLMVRQLVKTGSVYAQYLVPSLLLLGTASASVKNLSRSMTFDSVAGSGWFSKRGRARKVDLLSWQQFEDLVHEYFRRNGYVAAATTPGPDGGVDLEVRKDGKTATVQCKHWRRRKVDVRIVREQLGVMTAASADECFVVTSGRFTDEARRFATGQPISLVDGEQLRSLIRPAAPGWEEEHPISRAPAAACPNCGAAMKLRIARRGPNSGESFWGCSRFPKCRGTRQAN